MLLLDEANHALCGAPHGVERLHRVSLGELHHRALEGLIGVIRFLELDALVEAFDEIHIEDGDGGRTERSR